MVFGAEGDKAIRRAATGALEVASTDADGVVVHDPTIVDPSQAFALSRLTGDTAGVTPIGVFRSVDAPVYDEGLNAQIAAAQAKQGRGDLMSLLHTGDTWTVS
jgi:2-oxoglutarate ferredoxin oxidoreductase subunit beta